MTSLAPLDSTATPQSAPSRLGQLAAAAADAVEGIDGAVCAGNVKYLAYTAIDGLSAAQWRALVERELGPAGQAVTATAVSCMRSAGLYPWADG